MNFLLAPHYEAIKNATIQAKKQYINTYVSIPSRLLIKDGGDTRISCQITDLDLQENYVFLAFIHPEDSEDDEDYGEITESITLRNFDEHAIPIPAHDIK